VTHAHPDHCWGLVDESGVPVFPNAQVAIAKEELDYWLNESNRSVSFFADASVSGAIKNITPYLDKLILAHDGEQVVPGISALLCAGHSPGHMAYLIESGDSALVTTGDLAHHHILSLEHPEWRISYDTDPEHAVRSRRQLFDRLAAERILTHGYHFPWPGLGHVVKEDDRYRWIAAPSYTYIF
jgi:glyoxylase-like metal-dependent hydrolase (beta-lactamase superfamily II)